MTYGRGFGFRGASPSWPYVGRGRGGLPRCRYPGLAGPARGYSRGFYGSFQAPGRDQELDFLRGESETLKRQLDEIESRITKLEARETQG